MAKANTKMRLVFKFDTPLFDTARYFAVVSFWAEKMWIFKQQLRTHNHFQIPAPKTPGIIHCSICVCVCSVHRCSLANTARKNNNNRFIKRPKRTDLVRHRQQFDDDYVHWRRAAKHEKLFTISPDTDPSEYASVSSTFVTNDYAAVATLAGVVVADACALCCIIWWIIFSDHRAFDHIRYALNIGDRHNRNECVHSAHNIRN